MLESHIRKRLTEKPILLMTHIVLGYPSLEDSFAIIRAMVDAGVDLMELQIPFSEPIADGPMILSANQKSLSAGTRVAQCLDFAREIAGTFDIPFLFMTYYNILFKYGVEKFVSRTAEIELKGMIVPDLPPEEGKDYQSAMQRHGLSPIYIFSPTTTPLRMKFINEFAEGFVYCVARKGVTGEATTFSESLGDYLHRCRENTSLPLAVGFGVKDKSDIDFLTGKADIAVIGSETIRLVEEKGVAAVGGFIRGLRP